MKSLLRFFLKFGIWSDGLAILIIIMGLVSLFALKRSYFPEQTERKITVQVPYPGASPQEVEKGIVNRIEQQLEGIEGIEEYKSTSAENLGTVNVYGLYDYDVNELLTDVKNAVDQINSFPNNAEKPVVFLEKNQEQVITLILTSEKPVLELKREAERIEDDLVALDGVSQVVIQGLPAIEISVEVSEERLREYNLRFEDVAVAIQQNNLDLTAGEIEGENEEMRIRLRKEEIEADSIANIILRTSNAGKLIRIKDIGTVKRQFDDKPNELLFNGKNAIAIRVNKLRTEDLLGIVDVVKTYREGYNDTHTATQLVIGRDRSVGLNQRIELLVKNGAIGLFLVLIILGLFLNLRLAMWVAVGIPISFFGLFIVANLIGITINMLSLFGMILVVGILVDDGIVIAENIYAKKEHGQTPMRAAIKGTMEVWPSVLTSVSTTMIAFVPFFFIDSTLGEFVSEMALVVILCLAFSLVEAGIILPSHLVHYNALKPVKAISKLRNFMDGWIDRLRFNYYAPLIDWFLRFRWLTVWVPVIVMPLLVALAFKSQFVQFTFFPFIDFDQVTIDMALQPGTPKEQTLGTLLELQEKAYVAGAEFADALPNGEQNLVESIQLQLGSSAVGSGPHVGQLRIEILDAEARNQLPSYEYVSVLRERIGTIPDAESFTIGTRRIFGSPVNIRLLSGDVQQLEGATQFVKNKLRGYSELKDVKDNRVKDKREIELTMKPLAYIKGLSRGAIAQQVRRGFFGYEVQRLQLNADEMKVWVRYPEDDRSSMQQLSDMRIVAPTGERVALSELVDYKIVRGIQSIKHFNGGRELSIEADLTDQNAAVPPILSRIENEIMTAVKRNYPDVRYSFEGQAKENRRVAQAAQVYGFLAFLVVIAIVALSVRSLPQSIILVVLTVPIGVCFGILGHGLEGKPVSLFSIIGMIGLTGVIVNDAVVFVDRYNRNLKAGLEFKEALMQAGVMRFRAILLTSLTTVAGLYPLILETSTQAQFLIPMAISIAYGVLFATVIILLFVPVYFHILSDIRIGLYWLWYGKWYNRTVVEPSHREAVRLSRYEEFSDDEEAGIRIDAELRAEVQQQQTSKDSEGYTPLDEIDVEDSSDDKNNTEDDDMDDITPIG